ncbi:hypothetical protein BC938DRAFT_475093 [Jimgerdemannia flammicorona]|nr:hypothetical protein BC938DRAFT_475093 [Jimgerdemannia flammicorona]
MSEIAVFKNLIFTPPGKHSYYRLYGLWACGKCKKTWSSAHTYVSLEKYKNQVPAAELKKDWDYFTQKCKKCPKGDSVGHITEYKHLREKESDSEEEVEPDTKRPHISSLCEKCKQGFRCVDRF